jgi:hypothetical protein
MGEEIGDGVIGGDDTTGGVVVDVGGTGTVVGGVTGTVVGGMVTGVVVGVVVGGVVLTQLPAKGVVPPAVAL